MGVPKGFGRARGSSRLDFPSGSGGRRVQVNILFCTSQRQTSPRPHEVVLDTADGLDGNVVDCSIMFTADSGKLFKPRGEVVLDRRNASRDKRGMFRLAARDGARRWFAEAAAYDRKR